MSDEGVDPKRREPGRPRGTKVSDAQRAAGKANLTKAHEARRARKEARKAAPKQKPRWKQLEDGDIHVADLTTKELSRRSCANNDGSWEGARHQLPKRLTDAMAGEEVRRWRKTMRSLVRPALKAINTRIEDDDNPAQQFAAAKMAIEYGLGKVPEVVHHGLETEFDRMSQSAFIIRRGPDLAAELEAHQEPKEEGTSDDIVEAELVEEEA
jgi:hypothetical protein